MKFATKTIEGPESLGFYLSRASIVFRSLLKDTLEKSDLGSHIKPGMGSILFALYENDGQTKTELARRLLLSKMTITRLVRDVEKHGLVKATPDKNDGRANRVTLTPLAKKLEKDYRNMASDLENRLWTRFTEKEQAKFRAYLKTLLKSMDEEFAE
jgi:DNA-binding MarR family transcriptional regulator